MTSPISTIIIDLEKLDRPCRELDARIHCLIETGGEAVWRKDSYGRTILCGPGDLKDGHPATWKFGTKTSGVFTPARPELPFYTASIDAALALAEQALPGIEYEITNIYGVARAFLPLNDPNGFATGEHAGGSVPIAIVLATLRALEQKEAGDG